MPVGVRFSAPVQTSPGARTASYTVGTGSFFFLNSFSFIYMKSIIKQYYNYNVLIYHCSIFSGVKWPGRGVDHPPPSSADVKERVELYLYSTSGPSWPVVG